MQGKKLAGNGRSSLSSGDKKSEEEGEPMITKTERLFLQAVAAAIRDQKVSWRGGVSSGEWQELLALALRHKLFPVVLEAVYDCGAFHTLPQRERKLYQKQAAMQALVQTICTQDYGNLLHYLAGEGLHPLTVKGIVCRQLYPQPELRASADEDMLILPREWKTYHRAMLAYGMYPLYGGEACRSGAQPEEVTYGSRHSSLRVELHMVVFSEKNAFFGAWNRYFQQSQQQFILVPADHFQVRTMEETDHLFYLICHMLKHFCHSGFGIRQVCDLMLFAESCGEKICWERVWQQCQEIHGTAFVSALFQIAGKNLGMQVKKARIPERFFREAVEEEPLLKDILDAGIYGNAAQERIHSSALTLRAVTQPEKPAHRRRLECLHLLFPPYGVLKDRYPILQRFPWLLPGIWGLRILHYRKEISAKGDISSRQAVETLRIGKERTQLLKQYGIVSEEERTVSTSVE